MRALLLLAAATLAAQTPPVIKPPGIIKKLEPAYPPGAAELGLEATVVLMMTVNKEGRATTIEVLRPQGHGFDETAIACVRTWRFQPATRDDQPVDFPATVEVNFRLLGKEQAYLKNLNLVRYNKAVSALQSTDPTTAEKALKEILSLAKANFAPAQYSEGLWRTTGTKLPKDPARGVPLILAAAEKKFPAAVGQAGLYYHEGRYVTEDKTRGLRMLKEAAEKGSMIAQLFLGDQEQDTDPPTSARYFRLCAAQRQPICQTRLAEYLLKHAPADRRPEAVAWLENAARQNHPPAQKVLDTLTLTSEEKKRAEHLRSLVSPQ